MRDRDYYPAGAYNDSYAPYNEYVNADKDFDITCSQTLSKSDTVTTNKYNFECDYDEDGYWENTDTSDICWEDEWRENNHYTPVQLINLFKSFMENDLPDPKENIGKYNKYKHLISECENWIEDETEYVE